MPELRCSPLQTPVMEIYSVYLQVGNTSLKHCTPLSEELPEQEHNVNEGNKTEGSFPCNTFIHFLGNIIWTKQTMQSVKLSPEL